MSVSWMTWLNQGESSQRQANKKTGDFPTIAVAKAISVDNMEI